MGIGGKIRGFGWNSIGIFVSSFGSVAGQVIWVQGYGGVLMVAETWVETSSVFVGAVLGLRVDAAERGGD